METLIFLFILLFIVAYSNVIYSLNIRLFIYQRWPVFTMLSEVNLVTQLCMYLYFERKTYLTARSYMTFYELHKQIYNFRSLKSILTFKHLNTTTSAFVVFAFIPHSCNTTQSVSKQNKDKKLYICVSFIKILHFITKKHRNH